MTGPTQRRKQRSINAALVYDGDCAFCARCTRWVQRRLPRQPRIVPWQEVDLDAFGLTARECHDALQWVEPGRKEAGSRAVGRLLVAQGGAWSVLGRTAFVWPLSAAADALYRGVARNRQKLPGGAAECAVEPPKEIEG